MAGRLRVSRRRTAQDSPNAPDRFVSLEFWQPGIAPGNAKTGLFVCNARTAGSKSWNLQATGGKRMLRKELSRRVPAGRQGACLNARRCALEALCDVTDRGAYANLRVKQLHELLPEREAKMAAALVYHTLDHLLTIDYYLSHFVQGIAKAGDPRNPALRRLRAAVSLHPRARGGFRERFARSRGWKTRAGGIRQRRAAKHRPQPRRASPAARRSRSSDSRFNTAIRNGSLPSGSPPTANRRRKRCSPARNLHGTARAVSLYRFGTAGGAARGEHGECVGIQTPFGFRMDLILPLSPVSGGQVHRHGRKRNARLPRARRHDRQARAGRLRRAGRKERISRESCSK